MYRLMSKYYTNPLEDIKNHEEMKDKFKEKAMVFEYLAERETKILVTTDAYMEENFGRLRVLLGGKLENEEK